MNKQKIQQWAGVEPLSESSSRFGAAGPRAREALDSLKAATRSMDDLVDWLPANSELEADCVAILDTVKAARNDMQELLRKYGA